MLRHCRLPPGSRRWGAIAARPRLTGLHEPVYNAEQVAWVHLTLPWRGRNLDALSGRSTISAFGDGLIDIRNTPIQSDFEKVRCWRTGLFHVCRWMVLRGDPAQSNSTFQPSGVLAHAALPETMSSGSAGPSLCHHPFVSLRFRHTGCPVWTPAGAVPQGPWMVDPHGTKPCLAVTRCAGRVVQAYALGDRLVAPNVHSLHYVVIGDAAHWSSALTDSSRRSARMLSKRCRISRRPTPSSLHAITRRRRSTSVSSKSR